MPVDPELLDHLHRETVAVNAAQKEWRDTFGFDHICHCDTDYESENTGTVTECWADMANDALATCATYKTALDRIASGQVEDPVTYAQEFSA